MPKRSLSLLASYASSFSTCCSHCLSALTPPLFTPIWALTLPYLLPLTGFPDGSVGKESACNARDHIKCRRPGFSPWVGKIPWWRTWKPTPVFLPGKLRSLLGYSSWGCKELDMTEVTQHIRMQERNREELRNTQKGESFSPPPLPQHTHNLKRFLEFGAEFTN